MHFVKVYFEKYVTSGGKTDNSELIVTSSHNLMRKIVMRTLNEWKTYDNIQWKNIRQ